MTTDFARKALALHNKYRAHHNSLPLAWCQDLQKKAQAHATSLLVTGVGKGAGVNVGQNVFQLLNKKSDQGIEPVDDELALERAIDSWYEAIKFHDPNNPSPKGRSFLQLASPNTTKLGVGIARKVTATSLNIIVVAFYDTAVPNSEEPKTKNFIIPVSGTNDSKSAQQMPPGPSQQMARGPNQQMAPGPSQQMAPGPSQQMAPGPSQQGNNMGRTIIPQQRREDASTSRNLAQSQQRFAQNEAQKLTMMQQQRSPPISGPLSPGPLSPPPLQESTKFGQKVAFGNKSAQSSSTFQMQVVQSVQQKGVGQQIEVGGAGESRFLALAAQTSQFTQPQVINIGFQDGTQMSNKNEANMSSRGQQLMSTASKENRVMESGLNHAELEQSSSVSWSQQSTSRMMSRQSKTSSAQLQQERVTYQSLM